MGQNYSPFQDQQDGVQPQNEQQPPQGNPQQPGGYPQLGEQWGPVTFQPGVPPTVNAPQGYTYGKVWQMDPSQPPTAYAPQGHLATQLGPGGYYPGGYPIPPSVPAKKSYKNLWIGLIALALIAGGVAGFLILHAGPGDPAAVLQRFCNDARSDNFQDAYQINSDNTRSVLTEAQYVQALQSAFDAHQGVSSCQVSNVQVNGSSATGIITITFNDGATGSERDSLIQQDGTWKVDFSTPVN
jgi:hypothetical protein